MKIIDRIEKRVARDKYVTTSELTAILRDEIANLLTENNTQDGDAFTLPEDKKPYVIMVVGVNGVGKTTTIGKLAYQFKKQWSIALSNRFFNRKTDYKYHDTVDYATYDLMLKVGYRL